MGVAGNTGFTDALRKSINDTTAAVTKYNLGVDNDIVKPIMNNIKAPKISTSAILSDI